jgi:hypothetical protein
MSARIDEYHGTEAAPYTTADLNLWFDLSGVSYTRLVATTLALEAATVRAEMAEAELARRDGIGFAGVPSGSDLYHFMLGMSDLLGSRGCESPMDSARRVVGERDALRSSVEEARTEVARRDALLRVDGYEDMRQHATDLAQRLEAATDRAEMAEAERDSIRDEAAIMLQQRDRARRGYAAEIEKTRALQAQVKELEAALAAVRRGVESVLSQESFRASDVLACFAGAGIELRHCSTCAYNSTLGTVEPCASCDRYDAWSAERDEPEKGVK